MKLCEINEKYDFMKDVCFEHDEGWAEIIDEMCMNLRYFFKKEKTNYGFMIYQIKEKFGTLRIYHGFAEEIPKEASCIVNAIISKTEAKSACVCEKCGNWGEKRTNTGWVHTYCDKCEEEYMAPILKRMEERKKKE